MLMVLSVPSREVNAPVLKSVIKVPMARTTSHDSTKVGHGLIHELAVIHACVRWWLFLEDGLIHKHRGEGQTGGINNGLQRLSYACSDCQDSRQDARGMGSFQSCDNRIGRRLERGGIASQRIQWLCVTDHHLVRDIRGKAI
jgi:hypothetical protein